MDSDYSSIMQNAADMYRDYYDQNDRTYPEIYRRVSPYIQNALEALGDSRNLTDEEINMLTEKIINESNILSNPPERYNRETIFDFIKLLVMREMDEIAASALGPFKYYPYPYAYPYYDDFWGFPFFFGGGLRHRGFWGENRGRHKR